MGKWIAIVRDKDGKIHIFNKYTDDDKAFAYEVKRWDVGDTLVVYRESDIVQITTL